MAHESALLISAFLTFFNALCAVVFWRRASELTSQTTRSREAIRSVESFESRIDELQKRINSLSKKFHLEDRRDPETGKSRAVREELPDDPYERKAALRRQYGLNGMSHADIARRAMRGGE
jgi:CHASE1-domain containing sensor protein